MLNGSNILVEVIAPVEREYLLRPIHLIFDPMAKKRVTVRDWSITPKGALVFFWTRDPEWKHPMGSSPFAMDAQQATDFAVAWLNEQEYPKAPDTDGSVGKGFHLTTWADPEFMWDGSPKPGKKETKWPHPAGSHYAMFAVKPIWIVYGK